MGRKSLHRHNEKQRKVDRLSAGNYVRSMAVTGAPTKYKPEYAPMVEKMARMGLTDAQMADVFGVAMSTFSLWKTKHPEFSEANARGKPDIDAQVQQSLLNRALGGYTVKETVRDGNGNIVKTVEKEIPADTTAALRWLFNRQPQQWRERREEVSTGNENPLKVQFGEIPLSLADPKIQDNLEIPE